MLLGLILLTGSTVFLCVASSIAMLLVGRVLQGLSAALTWTVGLALVIDTVDPAHIGLATGWIGMATSLGILLAPLLGGLTYGKGGYYSVFAMCFGLLAVDIVLRLAIIEVKDAKKWLDEHLSQESSTSEMSTQPSRRGDESFKAPTEANITDAEKGESVVPNLAPCKPASSGFFAAVGPILNLLRKPRLLAALWGTLVHSIIATSFDSTLPLFVEGVFHWDSIGAGLIFLSIAVPTFLGPLIGKLGDRYGPKWLATAGFIVATPFLICLRFVEENNIGHKIMLCGLLVGVGIGFTLVFGPLMAEITWSVIGDSGHNTSTAPFAQAYGLYNMAFSGGAMLGPLLGGMIRDEAGWPTVCWVLGLLTAVTAVTQVIWVGEPASLRSLRRYRGS